MNILEHLSGLPTLESLPQQEMQEDVQCLREQEQHSHQMRAESLEELATVLQPRAYHTPFHDGPPLLAACGAIGEALGVPIHPPAASEDLQCLREPLAAMARASRLRLRQVLLTAGWWQKDNGPLLAYTSDGHRPVALLPVSATRYHLFDPQDGTRTFVGARLAGSLAPTAYMFYRPLPATVHHVAALFAFGLRGHGKDLLLVLLTGLAMPLLGMLTPQATVLMIDRAIPDADHRTLFQIGGALLAAVCGQALLHLAQSFALIRQDIGTRTAMQAAMWDRLLHLQPAFFQQYATGDLQARAMAVTSISEHCSGTTLRTVYTSLLALLNLGLLFVYSVPLALVASVMALVVSVSTAYAGVLTIRQIRPLQVLSGTIAGVVVQLIQGVPKLRVAYAEERAFAYWGKHFQQLQRRRRALLSLQNNLAIWHAILPPVASMGLFWWAVRLFFPTEAGVPAGGLTTGTFLAFYAAFGTFITGATSLSKSLIDLLAVATLWEYACPILEATPEVHAGKADPGRLSGKVALDHVTFRYHPHGLLILDAVSIQAEPGEFIALVGPSGGGKSTIFRLLLGFETPASGAIYYNDQDLAHLNVYAVRRQLGAVLQQSTIIAGTIFANIASTTTLTLDEAWEAARAAGLDEDITAMPMGMHTYISEGGENLSGGQRQRLLIARALALQPRVLLFDEATSALDNRLQALVTANLDRLRITRIVIAHRLSTIRNATRIYVLAEGRIVQQGRFAELAQQQGVFAQLMARQQW